MAIKGNPLYEHLFKIYMPEEAKLTETMDNRITEEQLVNLCKSRKPLAPVTIVSDAKTGETKKVIPNHDDLADMAIQEFTIVTFNNEQWISDKNTGLYRRNNRDIESFVDNILKKYTFSQKNATIPVIREVLNRIANRTTLNQNPFDFNQDVILVRNGVLDLTTRELKPFSPVYGLTKRLNVEFDPNADDAVMQEYLRSLVNGADVPLLTQMVAQSIMQETGKRAYVCYNKSGNNGKSTYLEFVRDFLGGENVSSISLQDFCKGGFRIANIEGKYANIFADLPKGTIFDDSTFKALTGNDTITIERKYQNPYNYLNRATLIFACNEFPEIETSSDAYYNRFYLIEFPNQFEVDLGFTEKLFTEVNKSAFLNLVLDAIGNIKQHGLIRCDIDTRDKWLENADNAYRFIKNRLVVTLLQDADKWISFDDLHDMYVDFCIEAKEKAKGYKKFKLSLEENGFRIKSEGARGEQVFYVTNGAYKPLFASQDVRTLNEIMIT